MIRKVFLALCLLGVLLGVIWYAASQNSPAPATGIANPASVNCEQKGGKLEMRTDSSGGVTGICKFSDGSECDEWAYFRGECKPGGQHATP